MKPLTIFGFLLIVGSVFSFDLSRSVDRTSVTLGDPIVLKVTALRKPDEKLVFPGPEQSFNDFELKDMKTTEEPKGSLIEETKLYQLLLFKLGSSKIPSLRVYNSKDTADFKTTDSVEIIVKNVVQNDSGDIIDIYGQEKLGYGRIFWLTILAVFIILGLAVYVFDKYFRKHQKPVEIPKKPPVPPEIQFENDIRELLAARHLEKGETKEFHLIISEILRRYLGSRLDFYALESTTMELFAVLKTKNIDKEVMRKIESFCDLNDPVKFAKWVPPIELSENLITIAREIKDKTTAKHEEPLVSESASTAP